MACKTPLLFLILFLILPGGLSAQRSLYQDALALSEQKKALATDRKNGDRVSLWVKPAAADGEPPRVFTSNWGGSGYEPAYLTTTPQLIKIVDTLSIYVEAAQDGDSLVISYLGEQVVVRFGPEETGLPSYIYGTGEVILDVNGQAYRKDPKIEFPHVAELQLSAQTFTSTGYGYFFGPEQQVSFRFAKDNGADSPDPNRYSYVRYQFDADPERRKRLDRKQGLTLALHGKLNELSDFYLNTEFDIIKAYQDNPFIFPRDFLGDYNPEIYSEYKIWINGLPYRAFPYQKILSGDSSLVENGPEIALNETTSYRQRIITAQDRLESANNALNAQRKKGGLLDVNTVAVGLSDFIAERAQEELNLTFFNRFKENLAKDSSELTVLFPTTRDLLNKFEISNYKVFLAHARTTFNNDLDQLGVNLSGVLNLPRYQRLNNDPDVFNLALIYDIANAAYREKTVEEIILTTYEDLVDRQQNLTESINLELAGELLKSGNADEPAKAPAIAFREGCIRYMELVQEVSVGLSQSTAAFREPSGDPIFTLFKDRIVDPETVANWWRPDFIFSQEELDERERFKQDDYYLANTNISFINRLAYVGGYNGSYAFSDGKTNTRHHGERVVMSYVDHSRNVIPEFLNGRDYYGYYLERPYAFQRSKLLNIPERPPVDYLATGIDRMRVFLGVPFDEYTQRHYQVITDFRGALEERLRQKQDDGLNENFQQEIRSKFDEARDELINGLSTTMKVVEKKAGPEMLRERRYVEMELLRREITAMRNDYGMLSTSGNKTDTTYTRASMVSGANIWLDKFEKEWSHLIQKAFTTEEVAAGGFNLQTPAYVSAREAINAMQTSAIKGFATVDRLLEQDRVKVKELGELRADLLQRLDALERLRTKELYRARENARELAKAVEVAAHILFSFRDYSQEYDTLYYQDTQRVEITVQSTDLQSGLVSTFKKDSSLVELTPVPGTTEKLRIGKWITRRQFDDLRRDKETWNIFLGLLYQRLQSIEDGPKFSSRGVAKLATQFLNVANEIQDTQDKLRFKKGTDPRSVGLKEYFPYIRSTVDLLNIVLTTPVIGDTSAVSKRASALGNITTISNEALSLYENIDVGEYGNAILNATELLQIITRRQYSQAELDEMDKTERKRRARSQRQIAAVFKYGTFMAEIINAKSSDQVKTLLKSTTLPPGSSRIKREVVSNFTVNSYLGAGLGRDRLLNAPVDINADALGAALSVPIGLTYSFSPKFLNNRSSFSVHVPLLDLGAITAYRSNPNGQTANVDALPELEWKNLFSPGAYLVYNFADSPFSVGVGGQYGPQLRELNQANGEPLFLNSWRFPMVFASIDVPFYNLHTGPRKIVVR